MQSTAIETGITFVDKKANTIYLNVGGYPITVVCQEQSNPNIYDTLKDIMVDSVFRSALPEI